MSKQNINVGTSANDKKGDSLRAAFIKVNANFTELYTALGLADTTLNLGAFTFTGSTMSTDDSTNIVIDKPITVNGEIIADGDIVPKTNLGSSLGTPTRQWKSLYVSTNTIYINNVPLSLDNSNNILVNNTPISSSIQYTSIPNAPTDIADLTDLTNLLGAGGGAADRLVSPDNDYVVTLDNTASLTLPDNSAQIITPSTGSGNKNIDIFTNNWDSDGVEVFLQHNLGVSIVTDNGSKSWFFSKDGSLTFPTLTTLDWDRRTLNGPTLQMGNDPTVNEVVITGPIPNEAYPNARRLIIQGQEGWGAGFGGGQAAGFEGGDVYVWAGHGGEGENVSGDGGDVKLRGGIGGTGGYVRLEAGASTGTDAVGGFVDLNAGDSFNGGGAGGPIDIRAGRGAISGGDVRIHTATQSSWNHQWTFGTDGLLTLAGGTKIGAIEGSGSSGVLTPTNTDFLIEANNGQQVWVFAEDGSMEFPNDTIKATSALSIATPATGGIPGSVANWNGQGGWNQGYYSNLATTGGTGTGLTVNVAAGGGGYININAITIHTPGSGYTEGDVITIDNENNLPGTFTIGITANTWSFGTDGKLTLPSGVTIEASNGSVDIIAAAGNGGTNYVELGSNDRHNYMWVDNSGAFISTGAAYTWHFGTDSVLTGPGGTLKIANGITTPAGEYFVASSDTSTEMSWSAASTPINSPVYSGIGSSIGGTYITNQSTDGTGNWIPLTWNFGMDGALTFPDDTVQTTAWRGIATELPTASTTVLGGVKVDGSSVSINGSGVISVSTGLAGSVTFKGGWNANTNTPALANGTGTSGWMYIVTTNGVTNLGAGLISYNAGDLLVYDGAAWINVAANNGVVSLNSRTGAVTLNSTDITTALGFTPYNATNPSGYITGINSSAVTTALGYTPYNATNPSNYITTSSLSVTTNTASGAGSLSYSAGVFTFTPAAAYALPTATTSTLGGIKIDNNTIVINDGVISVGGALTSATIFKGSWAADTNTPTLSNSLPTGVAAGWEYIVSVAGTRDIGAGSTAYGVGDLVIYNGTTWSRIPGGNNVTAFNSRQGAITLTSSDVTTALGFTPISLASVSGYQFYVAADDSTQQLVSSDEVIKFIGARGVTTTSDPEGAITITGPDLTTYATQSYVTSRGYLTSVDYSIVTNKPVIPEFTFNVAADDSTMRTIGSEETIKFIGSGGITTTTDAEGNVNIILGSLNAVNLVGTTLATGVVNSSLTSVGTLIRLNVSRDVTARGFNTDSITMIGNRIATTVTNANLEIEFSGTGGLVANNVADATLTSTAKSVGYLGLPQSSTNTSATLAIGDAGKHIYVNTASQTMTIPANSSVAYPIGTTLTFIAGPSATTVSIAITTDTMYLAGTGTTGTRTLAAHGMATAVKVASTTWYINGSGLT
jgi:hypothetical protein